MACIRPPNLPLGDVQLCSGNNGLLSGANLINYWCSHDCPSAYSYVLNTLPGGNVGYYPPALEGLRIQVRNLFDIYAQTNTITNDRKSIRYSPFQETLLDLCLDPRLSGICEDALIPTNPNSPCNGVTTDNLNPTTLNFCGCYLSSSSKTSLSSNNDNCPNDPCDPLCHRISTVQRVDYNQNLCTCPNNVCVINDVLLNTVSSNPGVINITTLCPYCGPEAGCTCIISSNNITSSLEEIGLGAQYNLYCGEGSRCYVNENGILREINCDTANPENVPINSSYTLPWIIALLLIFFFLAIFFLLWRARKR